MEQKKIQMEQKEIELLREKNLIQEKENKMMAGNKLMFLLWELIACLFA